ncbi:hypothetical protein BWI97_07310 [Siphonobacter sp. BAB-5405]|uniref:hypothetical protein n=1 Tax=Siphonobacter sp. BAB-5405 TaxID=1864825 RepID=UPI000C80B705|nr:hypothetical protein [Siphonobacter sp. BAB-5405]PMD97431.1 hypothetical protein BWI97_07310 [Siphonobacter sp. BAB-5405]
MNHSALDLSRIGFGSNQLPSDTYGQKSQLMEVLIKNRIQRRSQPKKINNGPRALSKRELTVALELTFLSTSFINRLDEMKDTSLYDQGVKGAVNNLEKALERYTYKNMWSQIEGEQASHNVMEQCDLGSQFVDRLLRLTTQIHDFDQTKYEAYVNAIEAVNQQFGLTLLWKANDPKN